MEVEIRDIERYLMELSMEKKVILKRVEQENVAEIRVYPTQYYYMELNTAKMLCDLAAGIAAAVGREGAALGLAQADHGDGALLQVAQRKHAVLVDQAGHRGGGEVAVDGVGGGVVAGGDLLGCTVEDSARVGTA